MPAFSLLPSSQGTYNQWALIAGASKPSALQSNDGDGSWVRSEATNHESMNMDNLPADAASISGSVTFGASMIDKFNWSQTGYIYAYNGTDSLATSFTMTASWAFYSGALADVPGGSGWTVAQVNDIQVHITRSGAERVGCTYMVVTGTYLQGGMYFIPIWNLVPFLFGGAGLIYREFLQMVAEAEKWRGGRKLTFSKVDIKRAWQEYKNGLVIPRYFDFGKI